MNCVFISHVEEDQELATAIATGLEASGFETWYYERDSDPGPSYLLQVHHAIERCVAVVPLISPNSIRSHQMTKEVARANDLGKPFIPVRSNISHAEFQARQPEWNIAIGAAASIPVPPTGVSGMMPRIVRGLEALRSPEPHKAVQHEHREDVQTRGASSTSPAPVVRVEPHAVHEPVTLSGASAPSNRWRQAAVIAGAVAILGVGAYLSTAEKPQATDVAPVASSNLASSSPKTPEASSLQESLPIPPLEGTADNGLLQRFDRETRDLLQFVRDEEQKHGLSNDVLAEIGRIGRRLVQMRQEYARAELDHPAPAIRESDDLSRLDASKGKIQKQLELIAELGGIRSRLTELGYSIRHVTA